MVDTERKPETTPPRAGRRLSAATVLSALLLCMFYFVEASGEQGDGLVHLTTCGSELTDVVAVLDADLDCSQGSALYAVALVRSTLLLQGHTLRGNPDIFSSRVVECAEECTVEGPGVITGAQGGIDRRGPGKLQTTVRNLTLVDNQWLGVRGGRVLVEDCIIKDGQSGGSVTATERKSVVRRTTLINSGKVHSRKGMVSDLTINGGDMVIGPFGIESKRVERTSFTDHPGTAIINFRKLVVKDSSITWTEDFVPYDAPIGTILSSGILGFRGVKLRGVQISGAQGMGVTCFRRPVLVDSIVVDSCQDPLSNEGSNFCADIVSVRRPRLKRSLCGSSAEVNSGQPWGVCRYDP